MAADSLLSSLSAELLIGGTHSNGIGCNADPLGDVPLIVSTCGLSLGRSATTTASTLATPTLLTHQRHHLLQLQAVGPFHFDQWGKPADISQGQGAEQSIHHGMNEHVSVAVTIEPKPLDARGSRLQESESARNKTMNVVAYDAQLHGLARRVPLSRLASVHGDQACVPGCAAHAAAASRPQSDHGRHCATPPARPCPETPQALCRGAPEAGHQPSTNESAVPTGPQQPQHAIDDRHGRGSPPVSTKSPIDTSSSARERIRSSKPSGHRAAAAGRGPRPSAESHCWRGCPG